MTTENKVFLSVDQLACRYSVSRATIWRWAKLGTLPQPLKLSPGCTRWTIKNIEEWEESQTSGEVHGR